MTENIVGIPKNKAGLITLAPSPGFDLKPIGVSAESHVRDLFSLSTPAPAGAVENTPKGQLPDHLKITGILIGHPSQIVINDTTTNTTYFIDEGQTQGGIKIVKAGRDQLIINYQGQDIPVPVVKE